jgi:hypothetical protein
MIKITLFPFATMASHRAKGVDVGIVGKLLVWGLWTLVGTILLLMMLAVVYHLFSKD